MIVLNFHGVSRQSNEQWICSVSRFERTLDLMLHRGYRFVELENGFSSRSSELTCALTFDDARSGIESNALPLLKDRGIPATVFVTTSFADGDIIPLVERYTSFLSWSAIGDVAQAGFQVGSHGEHHLPAYLSPENWVVSDVLRSKCILEERLGKAVTTYAAPHGQVTRAAQQAAHSAGYCLFLGGFCGWNGMATLPMSVRRISVQENIAFETFEAEIIEIEAMRNLLKLGTLVGDRFVRTDLARLWRIGSLDGVATISSDTAAVLREFGFEAHVIRDMGNVPEKDSVRGLAEILFSNLGFSGIPTEMIVPNCFDNIS